MNLLSKHQLQLQLQLCKDLAGRDTDYAHRLFAGYLNSFLTNDEIVIVYQTISDDDELRNLAQKTFKCSLADLFTKVVIPAK